jgi:RNA polymerase sigma-70 factor (ECF subfamily)
MVGDISIAEDLVQDCFVKASHWPEDSPPANPAAWLTRTAKNLAIDHIRRGRNWESKAYELAYAQQLSDNDQQKLDWESHPALQDDMLKLIFTCCHPALNQQAQVALCLNTVCGLTTEEIAKAFVTPSATMSQRLWRAKTKIKQAGIRYQIPEASELPARLGSVATVIYLIFNEGWLASSGSIPLKQDLVDLAIQTADCLAKAIPEAHDIQALLALMMLHNSRRDARFGSQQELVTLPLQDRSLWHKNEIALAFSILHPLFKAGHGNQRFALMAAIAAEHSRAMSAEQTNWREICTLYEALLEIDSSDVIRLNHSVAVSELDGPATALKQLDAMSSSPAMQRYYLFHSTRAALLNKLGQAAEAKMAYQAAKSLTANESEKSFLQGKMDSLE